MPASGFRGTNDMQVWRLSFILALALAASPFIAAANPPTPATASESNRLINSISTPSDFSDVSTDQTIALRHNLSGLIFNFSNSVQYNTLANVQYGFAFKSARPYGYEATQLFNFPGINNKSVEHVVDQSVSMMPEFRYLTGFKDDSGLDKTGSPLPPHTTRRIVFNYNGKEQFMRWSYAIVGDWLLLQRTEAPMQDAASADAQSESAVLDEIRELVDHRISTSTNSSPSP